MDSKLSRRGWLKLLAAAAGGAVVSCTNLVKSSRRQGLAYEIENDVYLPLLEKSDHNPPNPPPSKNGRVVRVSSDGATNWDQSDHRYWNNVYQNVINNMTDQGLLALTGASNVAAAWQTLLPNYQPGQGIAIKVNFNNSNICDNDKPNIDAIIEPVNAIVRGMKEMGVAERDIWVYDALRHIPNRFVAGCDYSGVQFFDTDVHSGCQPNAGFRSQDPTAVVIFSPPPGFPLPDTEIRITDLLINATYLINMPIMKAHGCIGVTLAFKNHFGSITYPRSLHQYCNGDPPKYHYSPDYSPFIDVYRNPNIIEKTILTIGDGLFGNFSSNVGPPRAWERTFGTNNFPNSLFFATDPVAIDCVMADFIDAEYPVRDTSYDYMRLGDSIGLGVFERGDPWGGGYQTIDYLPIDLS